MEIHSNLKDIDPLFILNNKFVKYYPFCNIISHDYEIKGNKKFIGMLSKNGITVLAAEYIFLGTYTKEKNLWVWADTSITMDKSMMKEIKIIREKLLEIVTNSPNNDSNKKIEKNDSNEVRNSMFRHFIEDDYMVLPTSTIVTLLGELMEILIDVTKAVILTNGYRDIVDVLLIKRIIHDGTTHPTEED